MIAKKALGETGTTPAQKWRVKALTASEDTRRAVAMLGYCVSSRASGYRASRKGLGCCASRKGPRLSCARQEFLERIGGGGRAARSCKRAPDALGALAQLDCGPRRTRESLGSQAPRREAHTGA